MPSPCSHQFFGRARGGPERLYPMIFTPIQTDVRDHQPLRIIETMVSVPIPDPPSHETRTDSSDEQEIEKNRRVELAEFLRARRMRLSPEQVGLPSRQRRRTPGLRREDVAERAGVSTAWYTYLEQGRGGIRPSRDLVASLAEALVLPDMDRSYLFTLTGHVPPAAPSAEVNIADLQQLVNHVTAPAYCTDASTKVLAWNSLATEVFGDFAMWPEENRNLLYLLFNTREFASRLRRREEYAARVVHTFRTRSHAYLSDPDVIAMVNSLSSQSVAFKAIWATRDLRQGTSDSIQAVHPLGELTFRTMMWQDVAPRGIRFSAYLPADAATMRVVQELTRRT